MKKKIKVATALTICGVVLVGAIYYTNSIYIPNAKKDLAEKEDSSAQADQSSDYHYTISSIQGDQGAAGSSSSDSSVQVTKESNGDVTINRTWDAKKGDLDTSTASPDSKTSANIGSGGAKIIGSDGTYQGETPAKSSSSTTTKSTTSGTSKSSSSSTTATKKSDSTSTSSSTPKNGDTRTVNGQKQIYDEVFGWGVDTSGGTLDNIEMAPPSGEYVGDFG